MKILVLFSVFALAAPLKLENFDFPKFAENIASTWGRLSLKEILEGLLKNLEGEKNAQIPLIELDEQNRIENVNIEWNISKITLKMNGDGLRKVSIENLTIPLSTLDVKGEYNFEELSLFDLVIYGRGDIIVKITNLNAFLKLSAIYKTSSGWKVKDLGVDTSVEQSLIKLENLMDGEPMGEFLNFMINELFKLGVDLLSGLVEQYKDELMKVLEQIMNSILDVEYNENNLGLA